MSTLKAIKADLVLGGAYNSMLFLSRISDVQSVTLKKRKHLGESGIEEVKAIEKEKEVEENKHFSNIIIVAARGI